MAKRLDEDELEDELEDDDLIDDVEDNDYDDSEEDDNADDDSVDDDASDDDDESSDEEDSDADDGGDEGDTEEEVPPVKEKPNKTIATMRQQINELTRQTRLYQEEKQRLENEKIQRELAQVPLVEPTFEGCGYDPELFKAETVKFTKAQQQREQIVTKQAEQRQKADKLWNEAQQRYVQGKANTAKDYKLAESTVESTLTTEQLNWLLVSTKIPNQVVYTAGKDEKLLRALSKADTPFEFAAMVGKIEALKGETRMGTKTPPKPEKRPASSGNAGSSSASKQALDRALEKASRTGNLDLYRELKNKQKKS